jgi:hypothetical protein
MEYFPVRKLSNRIHGVMRAQSHADGVLMPIVGILSDSLVDVAAQLQPSTGQLISCIHVPAYLPVSA